MKRGGYVWQEWQWGLSFLNLCPVLFFSFRSSADSGGMKTNSTFYILFFSPQMKWEEGMKKQWRKPALWDGSQDDFLLGLHNRDVA
jgi:hypothetical protein